MPSARAAPYIGHVKITFTKMNGAGNDFVLVDNRTGALSLTETQAAHLCHRQCGVGADGLILLKSCVNGQADWAWDFFNADGSAAAMCGNGARCFARFIQRVAGAPDQTSFLTGCGVIRARFVAEQVAVSLTDPTALRLGETIGLSTGAREIHSINTGVPHVVLFVDDADRAAVATLGPEIRQHPHFGPAGTNVNFVQILAPNQIRVRTYERGVGETLACGTGVTASALIAAQVHGFTSPIQVQVRGGDSLAVAFQVRGAQFSQVELTGPAQFVFEGSIEI